LPSLLAGTDTALALPVTGLLPPARPRMARLHPHPTALALALAESLVATDPGAEVVGLLLHPLAALALTLALLVVGTPPV